MGVALDVLQEIGVQALVNACEQADIIVIDEVGKLEVERATFRDAVKAARRTARA